MATGKYRDLLQSGGFESYLWTQFLGAFNDNTFKIVVSLVAVDMATEGSGYLSLYRGDGARTGTYSISFLAGQTRANNAVVQLALDLSGSFKVQNTAPGNVDFILDVNGYFR